MLGTVVLAAATVPAQAKHYRLFLLTGQSNSLGTTAGDAFDPAEEKNPADQDVLIFWSNRADTDVALGNSGGEFKPLAAQQGGVFTNCPIHWGPEIGFGRTLHAAGVKDFAIVKSSRGGGGNGIWSKELGGHMYTELVGTARQAIAKLEKDGHTYEIVGLIYLQGESDSPEEATLAGERLQALLDNLRQDLPRTKNLRVVIGGIAAEGETRDVVRKNQAQLAADSKDFAYFETIDLRPGLYDDLHYDRPTKLIVGKRFAEEFIKEGVVKSE